MMETSGRVGEWAKGQMTGISNERVSRDLLVASLFHWKLINSTDPVAHSPFRRFALSPIRAFTFSAGRLNCWPVFLAAIFLSLLQPPARAQQFDRDGWQLAEPNYHFRFPEDYAAHFSYRTEWWYFTGNLRATGGREFGYQLTFFRYGYLPPSRRGSIASPFVMADLKFAHFTVTDVQGKQFHAAASVSRGAFGEAGFASVPRLAWIKDWHVDFDGNFHLAADEKGYAIQLSLRPVRPPTLQGENGFSRKAVEPRHASEYYSITRLETYGIVRIEGKNYDVTGTSWFDREWATNQLTAEQLGWNWFSIQLSDGTDLMLYQMRDKGGRIDPASSGTISRADGTSCQLGERDFALQPTRFWISPTSKARYPIGWQLRIDRLDLMLDLSTPVPNQELNVGVRYWEGCIRTKGELQAKPVLGEGYLELTGYEGSLPGLR